MPENPHIYTVPGALHFGAPDTGEKSISESLPGRIKVIDNILLNIMYAVSQRNSVIPKEMVYCIPGSQFSKKKSIKRIERSKEQRQKI